MVDLGSRLAGYSSATALIEGGQRVTYAELSDRVLRTAGALQRMDLPARGHVAVVATPTVDGIVAYLGIQAAGMVPVMVSSRAPRAESEPRLGLTETNLVLVAAEGIDLPADARLVRPAGSRSTDTEVLVADPAAAVPVTAADPAVVLYTSGVSGLPKPIVLTYGNLKATQGALLDAPNAGIDATTTAFAGLPISHVFGLNSIVCTVLRAGGRLVLNDGFDPEAVADLVSRHRITALSAVPIMWKALAAIGDADRFATVVRATWSAAPMPPAVRKDVEDSLGLALAGGFGLTETAGTIVHDDPADPTPGSVGRPLGDTEIRLVDTDGAESLEGDPGEIWVRSPSLATAYLDGTAIERDDDGWFRTGDVGIFDDAGRLSIVDRKKDVINVSGFNVSPAEVESALASHPDVATSVVVGEAEDDREVVVAHVVPVAGAKVTPADLMEHCKTRLSRYKVPRQIFLEKDLPLTESGKAVRRLLGRDA